MVSQSCLSVGRSYRSIDQTRRRRRPLAGCRSATVCRRVSGSVSEQSGRSSSLRITVSLTSARSTLHHSFHVVAHTASPRDPQHQLATSMRGTDETPTDKTPHEQNLHSHPRGVTPKTKSWLHLKPRSK